MIEYDSTGKILCVLTASTAELYEANKREGYFYIDGFADSRTSYVVDEALQPRPTFTLTADKTSIAADGQDVITISGLPEGDCQLNLCGPVSDLWTQTGDVELTVNMAGEYTLRVSQWPYIDQEITFNAS
jgi:hypothetical protein